VVVVLEDDVKSVFSVLNFKEEREAEFRFVRFNVQKLSQSSWMCLSKDVD
jgi:hypothetical protein